MKAFLTAIYNFFRELAGDDRRRLIHFSISAVVFFICYAMLHWTNKQPPSLKQELYALVWLAIASIAFCYAIGLQLLFVIDRLFNK